MLELLFGYVGLERLHEGRDCGRAKALLNGRSIITSCLSCMLLCRIVNVRKSRVDESTSIQYWCGRGTSGDFELTVSPGVATSRAGEC
jgi:hypothetical protein